MANFKPTTFQDPSIPSISSGAAADYSEIAQVAANGIERIHNKNVAEKAFSDIQSTQDEYLKNRADIVNATSELAILRDKHPTEAAIVDKTNKRIKELQNFVSTGGISPTAAASRVETLRREAIAKAPIFANEIAGFSGEHGYSFETEVEQQIKMRNDTQNEMRKYGFNVDNPKHAEEYNRFQRLKFNNDLKNQEDIRDNSNAKDHLVGLMLEMGVPIENRIREVLAKASNNPSNIPNDVKSQMLLEIDGAVSSLDDTIKKLAVKSGYKLSAISPETFEMIKQSTLSNLNHYSKVLNGTILAPSKNNALSIASNDVMLDMSENEPGLFQLYTMTDLTKPGSVAAETLSEKLANGVEKYVRVIGGKDFNGTQNPLGMNPADNKVVMANVANFLKKSRNAWTNVQSPDKDTLNAHFILLNNIASTLRDNPERVSTPIIEELLASTTSSNFTKHIRTLDDSNVQTLSGNVLDSVASFAERKMVPDIVSDLNTPINLGTGSAQYMHTRGLVKDPSITTASDLINVKINSAGGLVFSSKGLPEGLPANSEKKVNDYVIKLNAKYSDLSSKMSITSAKLSGMGESVKNNQLQSVLFFQGIPGLQFDKSLQKGGEE